MSRAEQQCRVAARCGAPGWTSHVWAWSVRVGLCAALLAGCGDDADAGPPVRPRPTRDAGQDPKDAGRSQDAGPDADAAAAPDASDAAQADEDASVGEADPGEGCADAEEASFAVEVPFSDDSGFSLTTGTIGFGVAYRAPEAGCNTIWTLPVPASGAFEAPSMLLDDCKSITQLALLRESAGWRMAWIDNSSDRAELRTSVLDDAMVSPIGELRTTLTDNALLEQRPVLANLDGVPFVAFIATDPVTRKSRVLGLRLDGESELRDLIPEDADRKPRSLALAQIGPNHAVLAWVDEEPDTQGIWMQRLGLGGTRAGDPVKLSAVASTGSSVDLATRSLDEGGALLYSVNIGGTREVRFQRLNKTAGLLGTEIKIVSAPLVARDASFTRVGGGYAVAFRALPAGPFEQPQVRLAIITKEGKVSRDAEGVLESYPVADASADGGRVTIRLSNEGVLLVGFVDATEAGSQLRLVRKRLDCRL